MRKSQAQRRARNSLCHIKVLVINTNLAISKPSCPPSFSEHGGCTSFHHLSPTHPSPSHLYSTRYPSKYARHSMHPTQSRDLAAVYVTGGQYLLLQRQQLPRLPLGPIHRSDLGDSFCTQLGVGVTQRQRYLPLLHICL